MVYVVDQRHAMSTSIFLPFLFAHSFSSINWRHSKVFVFQITKAILISTLAHETEEILVGNSPMEEFLESEVLWPESSSDSAFSEEIKSNRTNRRRQGSRHGNGSTPSSPITIPYSLDLRNSHETRKRRNEEEYPELVVPPHVMMSQKSNGGKTEFSVRSGQGRTLRGRELWHVRNTVWRMTGFVDG
jgi:Senescence regulator